jgi:hypothetical protein
MINLRVLTTAAAMALLLPMVAPSPGSAQGLGSKAAGVGGGGGGGISAGGGGRGGGFSGGGISGGGGGGFRGAVNAPSVGGGPVRSGPSIGFRPGPGGGGGPIARGGGRHYGGGYRHHYRGGGFWPGFAVGAGIGSTYGYYGSPAYYDDSYGYYDDGVVAVAPPPGDDAVAYCMQRYKSYDPASGTYLGYDGRRHPCPAQ